ncbi:MAG: extensin family protein [Methylovirgula sp.]
MARCVPPFAAGVLLLTLAGCSNYEAQRPAWRAEAENACIAQNLIHLSAYVEPEQEIDGPGICGLTRPFKVSALLDGQVALNNAYTLDCPMIAALNNWVREVVEPEAQTQFNERVVEIESFGTYSCRGINGDAGARLSEHAFGNAIDVSGFRLADGREISIMRDWPMGDAPTQAFLRDIHAGACGYFTTVLGPGYNFLHYNHFHLDLAMRGDTSTGLRRVCRPEPPNMPQSHPPDGLPEPPPLDEEMDISQAGSADMQALALHAGPDTPDASLPPAPVEAYASRPRPDQAYQNPQAPPPQPVPSADDPQTGTIRADGAFAPEGQPSDWDLSGQK